MTPPARLSLAALWLIAACSSRGGAISPIPKSDEEEAAVAAQGEQGGPRAATGMEDSDAGAAANEGQALNDAGGPAPDARGEQDAAAATQDGDAPPALEVETWDAEILEASSDASAQSDAAPSSADASLPDAAPSGDAGSDAASVLDASELDASGDAGNDASARDSAGDWACFGKDLANTRFNAAETILSKTRVRNLARVWQRMAPGISATPAVVGDLAYWADWRGTVQATRISDGAVAWTRSFALGFTSSPCVSQSTLYVGDRYNTLHALDLVSGATRWSTQVNSVALTHLWSSPVVADGVVIIGISADGTNADREPLPPEQINTFRGAVVGIDARSGALLWRFETTRVVGERADRYGAGVSVWSSAAVDLERGLLFIGTGNSYALPASPYSDALLALRVRTGELAWHVQFTPNDGYSGADPSAGPDYDIGAAPNLFAIDGLFGTRDVVGVGDKGGRYRVFDRSTGSLIWERQLEPGFNLSGRKTGGIIAPAAVAYGRIFVASNTSWHDSRVWALDAQNGSIVWSSETIDSVNFGGPAVANGVLFFGGSGFRIDEDLPDSIGVGAPGDLIAFDVDNGSVLYRSKLYAGRGAGFSISQGRVFVGTGFTFYGYSDEPVDGALEVFGVP